MAIPAPVTAASSSTGIAQGLTTSPKMAAIYQPNKRQPTCDRPSGGVLKKISTGMAKKAICFQCLLQKEDAA